MARVSVVKKTICCQLIFIQFRSSLDVIYFSVQNITKKCRDINVPVIEN